MIKAPSFMPEPIALSTPILIHIAGQSNVPLKGLHAAIELLDGGGTVPFIARYRKEATGNLDEVQIRDIQEKLEYFRELEDRRKTVLETIAEQGKLTPELRARIEAALEKNELEDLYLPYKPKRRTKASIARDKGLEPLAQFLWNQTGSGSPAELAATFVSQEKGVASPAEALEGARHDDGRGDGGEPRHRGRARPRRQIPDVHGGGSFSIVKPVSDRSGEWRRRRDGHGHQWCNDHPLRPQAEWERQCD
jgi:hypothetical protein